MGKLGEIEYPRRIGEGGRSHAQHKPYSDPARGRYLQQIGAVLDLLPPPSARVLDLGCGTGWTTEILHRSGYDVVGVDISPDMIGLARGVPERAGIRFEVGDYEVLNRLGTFDAAVFFDSLHHATDERAALAAVYAVLAPGGRVVCSEPGVGHSLAESSRRAAEEFGVTEKDMPPRHIIAVGRSVGFASAEARPCPVEAADLLTHARARESATPGSTPGGRLRSIAKRLLAAPTLAALGGRSASFRSACGEYSYLRNLRAMYLDIEECGYGGLTVLHKGLTAPAPTYIDLRETTAPTPVEFARI